MYLLGQTLSPYKRVYYALKAFEGVGLATAKRLCDQSFVHPLCKVRELTDTHVARLKSHLQPLLEEQKQKKLMRMKKARLIPKPIRPT